MRDKVDDERNEQLFSMSDKADEIMSLVATAIETLDAINRATDELWDDLNEDSILSELEYKVGKSPLSYTLDSSEYAQMLTLKGNLHMLTDIIHRYTW
jgi:hypothetical protein